MNTNAMVNLDGQTGLANSRLGWSQNLAPAPNLASAMQLLDGLRQVTSLNLRSLMHCCCSVTQLCPALCDPWTVSPPGSSVHEIPLARILEWVAMPFSRGSSQPRDRTQVSCIAGRFLTILSHQGSPI